MLGGYRKRLVQDLDRWITADLVPEESREAILEDATRGQNTWKPSDAAVFLAIILLAMSAITFVAANWSGLDQIWKFILILTLIFTTYLGSALAFMRQMTGLGHGLALLGTLLFGAGISLTAQTFNMADFRNTGVLIWAGVALVTAIMTPSRPVLIAFTLLSAFWLGLELNSPYAPDLIWGYPPLWGAGLICAYVMRSKVSLNLLFPLFMGWLVYMFVQYDDMGVLQEVEIMSLLTLIALSATLLSRLLFGHQVFGSGISHHWFLYMSVGWGFSLKTYLLEVPTRASQDVAELESLITLGGPAFWIPALVTLLIGGLCVGVEYGRGRLSLGYTALMGVLMASLFMAPALSHHLQLHDIQLVLSLALSILVLAVSVLMITTGAQEGQRMTGIAGILLFTAEVFYIYAELFGDLLNTALFFFLGGVILLILALGLPRFIAWVKTRKTQRVEA